MILGTEPGKATSTTLSRTITISTNEEGEDMGFSSMLVPGKG